MERIYSDLADWWPLLSTPSDYEGEARQFTDLLQSGGEVRRLLELGSGGGNNASHMKRHFELTLVDRAPEMLAVSRRLNPECEHHVGDMRSVRLGQTFDAIFVHDAVCYLTSPEDVRAMLQTAAMHTESNGTLLVVPDFVQETFRAGVSTGGHDGIGRSLRYMEWTGELGADGTTYEVDYALLLREGDGRARVASDHHVCGVFSREQWQVWFLEAGFRPRIRSLPLDPDKPETEAILGRKL